MAALASQNGELDSLQQRLSIVLASEQFTVHMDKYLEAHFSAVERLDVPKSLADHLAP